VDQTTPPNTNLANAATWLAMLDSIKNDWDPDNLRIFTGRRMSCDYDTLGSLIVNCCDTDPTALIGNCSDEEILLAQERRDRKSHYVGNRCVTTGPFGICLRREEVYCSYSSQLARMIHDQGQPQLGLSWGSANSPICDGFTVEQFTAINWSLIDFSEWYANVSASIDPVGITSTMTTRICAATGSC
jgi:conjugal transfer mating pair stabilization protein TraN